MRGKFITVEGSDGSGKTTFINFLTQYLKDKGYKVITTREPGGTEFSEKVRELLFDKTYEIDAKTESLLFCVSRRDHIIKKIIPYVEDGYIVICDRFVDSSIAYQSYGRGLSKQDIIDINKYATDGLEPDLTLYFKVDVEVGLSRTKGRDENNRMDQEDLSFYKSVKHGYDELSEEYSNRIKVVDANQTYENVEKEKGIIAQEIKMYDDDPNWRVFFNSLKAMYKEHPNSIDIAGTVDSIYKITKEELYDCYSTFYSPSNMALFIVGDVDIDSTMNIIKSTL